MAVGALAPVVARRALLGMARFAVSVDGVIEADVAPLVDEMAALTLPGPVSARRRMATLAGGNMLMGENDVQPLVGVVAECALVGVMVIRWRFMARFAVWRNGFVIERRLCHLPVFRIVTGYTGAIIVLGRCRMTSVTDVWQDGVGDGDA